MSGVSNTEPLRRLLLEADPGVSDRELAARVHNARGKSWFFNVRTARDRPLLSDEDLDVLSSAFRVARGSVREADLVGHGLAARGEQPVAWLLEDDVRHLSDRQRAAIRAVIASMGDAAGEYAAGSYAHETRLVGSAPPFLVDVARAADDSPNRGQEQHEQLERLQETPPHPPDDDEAR